MATINLSLTTTQYRGTSTTTTDQTTNTIGTYTDSSAQRYHRIRYSFTPSKNLSKVVFTIKRTSATSGAVSNYLKGKIYYKFGSADPKQSTSGATQYTTGDVPTTLTITWEGNFSAGTTYYMWLFTTFNQSFMAYCKFGTYSAVGTVKVGMKIKTSDGWQDSTDIKVKASDGWKTASAIYVKTSDGWKST